MRTTLRAAAAASIAAAVALTTFTPALSAPRPAPVAAPHPRNGNTEQPPAGPTWPDADQPGGPVETDPDQGDTPTLKPNVPKDIKDQDRLPGNRTDPEYRPDWPKLPDVNDFHRDPRYRKYYQQTLQWSACDLGIGMETQCAKMLAPRTWYNPAKGDLTVSITRTLVDGKPVHNERLLLSNPGGPGGTSLGMSGVVAQIMGLTASHTPVDVQPRGLEGSTPIDCGIPWANSSLGKDGESRDTSAREAADVSHSLGTWFRDCQAKYPDLLPYINTDQTVRDFNLVRVLFGYEKMDYIGVSYGTWLGAYLAKAFPRRVDRVILDSNLGWQSTYEYQNHLDMGARQEVYDAAALPWLARRDATLHLGTTAKEVDATVERIRAAATRHELGGVTPDMVDIVADGGTSNRTLGETGEQLRLLNLALKNDPEGRAALPGIVAAMTPDLTGAGPMLTMSLAVVCGDTPLVRNQNLWYPLMSWLQRRLPLTAYSGGVVEACAEWPYSPAMSGAVMSRPFDALLLQNELDPSTPYSGFLSSLRRASGNLTTVFVDNAVGHGATNNDRAAAIAIKYMATGQRPDRNVAVTGVPMPGDDVVYEYKQAASAARPLPMYGDYITRVLRDPKPATTLPPVPDGSGPQIMAVERYPKGDPMWELFNKYIDGKVKAPKEVR